MEKWEKLLEQLLHGTSDANISFVGICSLMKRLGFPGVKYIVPVWGRLKIVSIEEIKFTNWSRGRGRGKCKAFRLTGRKDLLVLDIGAFSAIKKVFKHGSIIP